MTSPDYRALCAELLKELALFVDSDGDSSYISDDEKEAQAHVKDARALIAAARAALAEPEPKRPTSEELLALWHGNRDCRAVPFARAVLAIWGNPAPIPPANGEVAEDEIDLYLEQ